MTPRTDPTSTIPPQPNVVGLAARLPVRFWTLLALTGIGAGLGGAALMLLLHAVQHLAWSYHAGNFLDGVQRSGPLRRVLVVLAAGALVGFGRRLLRYATGGHAGDLSERIWFHSGTLPFFPTIGRAILSIVVVGMGASIGREGSAKQTGAAIASALADRASLPPAQRRLLAACGAGAGMAAIYNVPLGGALFALEVLLGSLALPLALPAIAASFIATAVSWIALPPQPTYAVPAYHLAALDLVWAVIVGPVAGLAAAVYVTAIGWADGRRPRGAWAIAAPLLVFAPLGVASLGFPQLLGNGKDVVQLAFVARIGLPLAGALFLLKPLATVGCLGSGTPGGLFTPTMTYGAVLGVLLGHAWAAVAPDAQVGSLALIGATAVLAAATQGPISSIVLVLELTRHIDALMVPLMLAVAGATLVTRWLDVGSIYSVRVRAGRAAALAQSPGPTGPPGDRGAPEYEVVSAAAPYAAVLRRLLDHARAAAPLYVVDQDGRVLGEIEAARAASASEDFPPLETTTAADLVRPVAAAGGPPLKPPEPRGRF